MELIYLGNSLDAEKEHELLATNEHGFSCTIIYHDGSTIKLGNCTEVHHLYPPLFTKTPNRIAFESDHHKTGCTKSVDDIRIVYITSAESLSDKFYL